MPWLGLVLALSLGPAKAAHAPRLAVEGAHVHLDASVLAPVRAATPEVETLGAILAGGIVLPAEVHLGVDGQPSMPFLGQFLFSQEIRITHVDPMTLATSLMVTARLELD